MNRQPEKIKLHCISILSSSICNLNCPFCYLHKNESYKVYDNIIREAWKDGSYINNIYKTVLAYPADPKDVNTIQMWGGETLIHIDDITKNLSKFFEYFPNINQWENSTNWNINIPNFVEFLFPRKWMSNCWSLQIFLTS